MSNDNSFISGDGVEINASFKSRFSLHRKIVLCNRWKIINVRADNLWQEARKAKVDVKYMRYEDKAEYIRALSAKFYFIESNCSPTQMFFTQDVKKLIENILEESKRGGIKFILNEFDWVPEQFSSYSGEEQLIYLIRVKFEAYHASHYLDGLTYLEGHRIGYNSGSNRGMYSSSFLCTLSEQQASYLCKILKKLGFLPNEIQSYRFIDYLTINLFDSSQFKWNVGTAILLYFFERLFLEKYILNEGWHVVISQHRNTVTKHGNRLSYSNCTTTLGNIRSGKYPLKKKELVDVILKKLKFYGDSYSKKH